MIVYPATMDSLPAECVFSELKMKVSPTKLQPKLDRLSWSETLAGDSSRTKVPKPAGVQQKVWQYSNSSVSKSIKAVCREQTLREIRPILTSACLEYSSPHWYFSWPDSGQFATLSKPYGRPLFGGFQNRRTSTHIHIRTYVHTRAHKTYSYAYHFFGVSLFCITGWWCQLIPGVSYYLESSHFQNGK